MSYTIRQKRSSKSPPGDVIRCCSYCGIPWYRSQLVRDASGNLACPDDQRGRDVVTLDEENLAWAASRRNDPAAGMPSDGTAVAKSTDVAPALPSRQPTPPANLSPVGVLSVQTLTWLRGDQVTLGTAGGVSSWNDQSNSNNAPVAGTLAAQPAWAVSDATLLGLPTVTFDGATSFLTAPLKTGGPLWVWLICKQITWSAGTVFNLGFALQQHTATPSLNLLTNGAPHTDNAAAVLGTWFRGICSFNLATTDTLTIHATAVSDASAGQRNGTGFILGAGNTAGAAKSNVALAELVVTSPAPTAAEIASIEAYGLARYGSSVF